MRIRWNCLLTALLLAPLAALHAAETLYNGIVLPEVWAPEARTTLAAHDYSTFFFNPFRKVWVASIRYNNDTPRPRRREYFESRDFLTTADWAKAVYWTGADTLDSPEPPNRHPGGGVRYYPVNGSPMVGLPEYLRTVNSHPFTYPYLFVSETGRAARRSCHMKILLLLALALPVLAGEPPNINYDESKVGPVVLPEVLLTAQGAKVTSARQWEQQRRGEVWQLFQEHVYGRMPPKPADLRFVVTATKPDALGGKATRKFIHISLADHPQWKGIDLMLHVPNGAKGEVPVFVGLSFGGNHTVVAEPDVPVHQRWARTETKKAGEGQRGRDGSSWQLEMILDRGFALATAYYGDIEPDHPHGWKDGVRAALSKDGAATVWKDGDWAAIGAWSWGLSRMLDYLETDPSVDAKKAAVIGHSRLGKTALWTGASDPRFALVIANNSGEGGASLMRRDYGETTQSITKNFPHWFTPTYRSYVNRADACPVDQHMLVALIAPRPVYIASAVEDKWADPKGEFLSGKFAEPVYALYGKNGLGVEDHPAVDQPVGDVIGYHMRTGKHDVTEYDWRQYLAFAARHFGVAAAR